jgi:hypothetical protein
MAKFYAAGLHPSVKVEHMDGSPLFIDYSEDFDFNPVFGSIRKYIGDKATVIIPTTIGGDPVLKIDSSAFYGNETVRAIILPEGLEVIGSTAFSGCPNLESINIPDSIIEVENSAFGNTPTLKLITWSSSLDVPDYAFKGSGVASVVIPDGVKKIGAYAFDECANLRDVYIGNTVTEMGEKVFRDCVSLEVIDFLPGSLKEIPADAFSGCHGVKEIHVPEGVTRIADSAFWQCGYSDVHPSERGVTYIRRSHDPLAEYGDIWVNDDSLPNLLKIYLPSTIEYIGWGVFDQTRIGAIYLPEGMLEVSQLPEFDDSFDGVKHVDNILLDKNATEAEVAAMNEFFMDFDMVGDCCEPDDGASHYYFKE